MLKIFFSKIVLVSEIIVYPHQGAENKVHKVVMTSVVALWTGKGELAVLLKSVKQ